MILHGDIKGDTGLLGHTVYPNNVYSFVINNNNLVFFLDVKREMYIIS